jgi:metallo-beta-lactamase family protein
MKLSFHGADRDVTGSCHMIETSGCRILIDCGMFQGGRELDEENAEPFGFDPTQVDFLLLTHAHLDHCGRLPLLVKRGFRGEIITTAASRELIRLVLLDSAHLQEEDARHRSRVASRHGHDAHEAKAAEPLYSVVDALNSLDHFGRTAVYGMSVPLKAGLRATFFDAGHILGSASILIEGEGQGRRIVFSGDLGNAGRPLLHDPVAPPAADVVVMESTYGDRQHRSLQASVDELYLAIEDAFARGGNVIIPTFALERAQEILFFLHKGLEQNRLNPAMQVFLDSPMAISATEIFRRYPELCKPDVAAIFARGGDPFALPGLHLTRENAESIAINKIRGGALIMAGSGMATGGRVRHHLRHNLPSPQSSVIFVGFAGKGTLGRQIIDGAKHVRLFDEDIPVRARIYTINGFSAHADQRELTAWLARINGVTTTILVHGEENAMRSLAGSLGSMRVVMPRIHDQIEI